MKKVHRIVLTVSAIFILFAVVVSATTLIVKVQTTNLRKAPKFYAQTIAILKAGETVEKISSQDDWIKVRTVNNLEGWIHSSVVQVKKFKLFAAKKGLKTQASADEVALAGKGFNKQVEDLYKAKHGEISFIWVDNMLKISVSVEQIKNFLKKGKLGEFRGVE